MIFLMKKRKRCIIHSLEPNANADGSLNYPGPVNDIALLELAEEVDLTMYTPVCLAHTGLTEAGINSFNISSFFSF